MKPGAQRFMESMWKDLPASVLERVFTFLPIASLCRFRTLSKEWNRSITSPSFKHAGVSSDEVDYALITPSEGGLEGGWVVLDVPRMRYFTLSNAFLTEYLHRLVDAAERPFLPGLAASDGGLFCIWYCINKKTSCLFVCNPVLKTVKQLPHAGEPAFWSKYPQTLVTDTHRTIVMATDRRSMKYEIIIVNTVGRYLETSKPFALETILVYESKTGRWRTAPCRPFSYQIWWGSLTVFDNKLYCIVNRSTGDSSRDGLVSYDKETGVVSDLPGIDFPSAPFPSEFRSRLVVSKAMARLFCVIPVEDPLSLEIFEVDVVQGASTRLTEMPRALIIWVLGHDLECSLFIMESKIKAVTACADWILIASVVGRCAAYSLSGNSWYQFPDDRTLLNAFRQYYEENDYEEIEVEVYGSCSNCLSLCAP